MDDKKLFINYNKCSLIKKYVKTEAIKETEEYLGEYPMMKMIETHLQEEMTQHEVRAPEYRSYEERIIFEYKHYFIPSTQPVAMVHKLGENKKPRSLIKL